MCGVSAHLLASAAGVAASLGSIAALAFALTMHFARNGTAAADHGLHASLFAFSRLLVPALAGLVIDRWGIPALLAWLAAAMLGVRVMRAHLADQLANRPT